MTKQKILVVEPDENIRNMLDSYFTNLGYDMLTVETGENALALIATQLVDLIIMETMLPNMSGYEVVREQSVKSHVKHIPVMLIVEKNERSDFVGIQFGYDNYVTKPFDIEELKLRIQNAINASIIIDSLPSITNFPLGGVIEEHLNDLMLKVADWSYIDIKITNFDPFKQVYGWQAGDEVIRATALMITDTLKEHGTDNDFAGHPRNDNFVIISHAESIDTMIEALKKRFNTEVQKHYYSTDRERGYMLVGDDRKDLMTLATGSVSTRTHQFSDIREMTESAADDRRRKLGGGGDSDDATNDILEAW